MHDHFICSMPALSVLLFFIIVHSILMGLGMLENGLEWNDFLRNMPISGEPHKHFIEFWHKNTLGNKKQY